MPIKNPNPSHPGEILANIYLADLSLTQTELARRIGCSQSKVNEIINSKRGITAKFALDLERVLGTTAEMWLNMQAAWDLAQARVVYEATVRESKPVRAKKPA